MSSGTAPCRGYVLSADKLENFGWTEEKLKQLALDNGAGTEDIKSLDDALNFLSTETVCLPLEVIEGQLIGINVEIFRYDPANGDVYDDLEDGYYIIFDEEDLYEKKLSAGGRSLEKKGLLPEAQQWTNYG